MHTPALAESSDDIAYVTAHFLPHAAVSRPGLACFGTHVPGPTYRLADGSEWFARDVWRLADDAGSPTGVHALFARRYRAACATLRISGDLGDAWQGYCEGVYGACLRDVTPETIAAKTGVVARLEQMLAHPVADDHVWRAQLRADVELLDGLLKPFAACDRRRFGPTSRDRLVDGARTRFPEAFSDGVRRDLAVRLPHRPGALAELGEALGAAQCSIEGGGGFTVGDTGIVHFLVGDADRAAAAARAAGFEVLAVRDVVVQRLEQDRPGQLGALARAMADAGVNIEAVYSDHDRQLILGVDDLAAAQRVSDAWTSRR